MQKILSGLKRFFFPPPGSSRWLRVLPFVFLGFLTVAALLGSIEGWNYTNSPEFCGTACHTMPPEYSAYLESPHARVQCVECHIGRDIVTTQFTRKAGDLRHVFKTLTETYEYPIFIKEMRPARDTCERCHFPEKFSDDSLRQIHNYGTDATNSLATIYLILKTGGGSQREGLGRGIHWHIENKIYFLATDSLQQDIPYVRTVDAEGNIKEYYDVASDIAPEDVAGSYLETVECVTCHNRITHSIPAPDEAVNLALSKHLIDSSLPEVKLQAMTLLETPYPDQPTAFAAFEGLQGFYAQNYPEAAAAQSEAIAQAIATLKDMYSKLVFAHQKTDWTTHPDNLGHKDSPGCFRCHDGKHLTQTGEAIRLECNLCHAVPVTASGGSLTTIIELARGPEPVSHTHSSWITLHGKAIDISCASCHPPADLSVDYTKLAGQKPPSDGSFCGNTACHDSVWAYSGFDSPALAPILDRELYALLNTSPFLFPGVPLTYKSTFEAMLNGRCSFCHSGSEPQAGLDVTTYESLLLGGKSGPGIVPGDPPGSEIVARQSASPPHFGQLLQDELEALQAWVQAGAP